MSISRSLTRTRTLDCTSCLPPVPPRKRPRTLSCLRQKYNLCTDCDNPDFGYRRARFMRSPQLRCCPPQFNLGTRFKEWNDNYNKKLNKQSMKTRDLTSRHSKDPKSNQRQMFLSEYYRIHDRARSGVTSAERTAASHLRPKSKPAVALQPEQSSVAHSSSSDFRPEESWRDRSRLVSLLLPAFRVDERLSHCYHSLQREDRLQS